MKGIYAITYIEACKSQNFNGVWTRDLVILVRRSNQLSSEATNFGRWSNELSYEAIDFGRWSFVGPTEPVRNECEVLCEVFHILNCRCEMKWAMILAVMKGIYAIAYVEAFNRVSTGSQQGLNLWPRDTSLSL